MRKSLSIMITQIMILAYRMNDIVRRKDQQNLNIEVKKNRTWLVLHKIAL